jgi:hypothetical protein
MFLHSLLTSIKNPEDVEMALIWIKLAVFWWLGSNYLVLLPIRGVTSSILCYIIVKEKSRTDSSRGTMALLKPAIRQFSCSI